MAHVDTEKAEEKGFSGNVVVWRGLFDPMWMMENADNGATSTSTLIPNLTSLASQHGLLSSQLSLTRSLPKPQ
jgi:hypothetical protein